MSENLASFVTDSAERFGDRPALKLDDTVVNYALLNEGSARIAKLLKDKGLERGDRVGIMLPNVPYFAIVYYGVLRAGGPARDVREPHPGAHEQRRAVRRGRRGLGGGRSACGRGRELLRGGRLGTRAARGRARGTPVRPGARSHAFHVTAPRPRGAGGRASVGDRAQPSTRTIVSRPAAEATTVKPSERYRS